MSARPSWRSRCSSGGHLTHDDLERYRVELREPLYWRHQGATVALNPPPAASGALIAFGLAFIEMLAEQRPRHRCADAPPAMAATNAARATHGEGLARASCRRCAAKELREARRHPAAYRGTTHVSVIDAEGNAAAVSLSNGEGNGFIVGNFGFMLNNMLGEEDLSAGGLEAWREGTRLSSMMAPTIILEPDGAVTALGTGGSNRIRSAILQVAVNLLDHGMSLEDAVEAPRLHVERRRHGQLRAGPAGGSASRVSRARRARRMLGPRAICSSAAFMPRAAMPMAEWKAPAIRAAKASR